MADAKVDEDPEFGDHIEDVFNVPDTWRLYPYPVTAHPAHRQLASSLCCLPAEIRVMIYDLLVQSLGGWIVHVGTYPGKEKVRYLRKEVSGLVWHADKHMYTGGKSVDWFCHKKHEIPGGAGDGGVLSLLVICKLLYTELSALLYQNSHFWFAYPKHFVHFSRTISMSHLNIIQFLSLDWEIPSKSDFRPRRAKRALDEFRISCELIAFRMEDLKELRFHNWRICTPWEFQPWDIGINMYRDIHRSMRQIVLPQLRVKHIVCSWEIGKTGEPRVWKDFMGEEKDMQLVVLCHYKIGTLGYEMAMRCDWRKEMETTSDEDLRKAYYEAGDALFTGYHQTHLWPLKVEKLGINVVNRIIEGRSRKNNNSV